MTPLAAMKQALEALEFSSMALKSLGKQGSHEYMWNSEAASALRAAITEMEKAEPVAWLREEHLCYEQTSDIDPYGFPVFTYPPKQQQTIPEGWQLVPKGLNREQINRGADELRQALTMLNAGRSYQYVASQVFNAMLAAAPKL